MHRRPRARGCPTFECDVDPLRNLDVLVTATPVRRVWCTEDFGYATLHVVPDFYPGSAASRMPSEDEVGCQYSRHLHLPYVYGHMSLDGVSVERP